MKPGLTEEIAK